MPELTQEQIAKIRTAAEKDPTILKDFPEVKGFLGTGTQFAGPSVPATSASLPQQEKPKPGLEALLPQPQRNLMVETGAPMAGAFLGGAVGGPPGMIAGGVVGAIGANLFDAAKGIPTSAVPFTSISTGNPVLDAIASEAIPLGIFSKTAGRALKSTRSLFTKERLASALSKGGDPVFNVALRGVQKRSGIKIPIVPASEAAGDPSTTLAAQFVAAPSGKVRAIKAINKALKAAYGKIYGLNLEDVNTAKVAEISAEQGAELARKSANGISSAAQTVPDVARLIDFKNSIDKVRLGNRIAKDRLLENMPDDIPISSRTVATVQSILARVKGSDIFSPAFKRLNTQLEQFLPQIEKRVAVIPGVPGKPPRTRLRFKEGKLIEEELPKTAKPGIPSTKITTEVASNTSKTKEGFLNILEQIDEMVQSVNPKSLNTQQKALMDEYGRISDALGKDLFESLDDAGKIALKEHIQRVDEFNNIPNKLVRTADSGEYTGFMAEVMTNPVAGRTLVQQVGKEKARSMVATQLMENNMNPDGTIDFLAIAKTAKGQSRQALRAVLGSDGLQTLNRFATVAAGSAINKSTKNMIFYVAGAGAIGVPILGNPKTLAKTASAAVMVFGLNDFMKKMLFDPRLGEIITRMVKIPKDTPEARKAFKTLINRFNGIKFTVATIGEGGKMINSKEVTGRGFDKNGDPLFEEDLIP